MPRWLCWLLGVTLVASLLGVPFVYYRAQYAHAKRLREVTPDRFYRSGQLTATGLQEAIERYGIKTVINLQNEAPDPEMPLSYYNRSDKVRESELCKALGVQYILLEPDLIPPERIPQERPAVIDQYLKILDDETVYPVLLHCKAGLHRTGLLTAIYRMEYEGWTLGSSVRELRANGFGDANCNTSNDYIVQYLQFYQPRRSPK